MEISWEPFMEHAMVMGARVALSLAIYAAFHIGAVIVRAVFRRIADRINHSRRYVINLLGQVVKITLIVMGLITALGTLGINVTALVAGLGLTGFALGFALKDAVSNLLAGVLILFYQPFTVGDRILVTGQEGEVREIDLRYTTLNGNEGKRILIPNSSLFSNVVVVNRQP